MSAQSNAVVLERGGVVAAPSADALATIQQADIALSVWRRPLDAGLAAWLDGLPAEVLPDARFVAPRLGLSAELDAALASLPPAPERSALKADIIALADAFCESVVVSQLRIRLEAIEGDACRRFHKDSVAARLLCTYRGPATEWGYAPEGGAPATVHALGRGEVSVWKGSKWPGAAPHDLVHRSPPIAGTGVARLLLVIDPSDPQQDEMWAAHARPR